MDEEIKTCTIEEQETAELARLYTALESKEPGSEEYNSILNEITKIRSNLNESNKIWVQNDENEKKMALEEKRVKQDKVLGIVDNVVKVASIVVSTGLAWVTMKYNIKFGPISSKDAWNQIFKKKF